METFAEEGRALITRAKIDYHAGEIVERSWKLLGRLSCGVSESALVPPSDGATLDLPPPIVDLPREALMSASLLISSLRSERMGRDLETI